MRKNRNLKAIYINRFKEMWPEFTRISAQCHTVRFDEDQQGADIWLPIPSEFLKGELSDEERKAVAGRSIMIRWDILKGKFLPEAKPGELMLIGFGIFPAKFLS